MNAHEALNPLNLRNENNFIPNQSGSVGPVVDTFSVTQQDKIVNDYVYGKKFRAILAAEGVAIVDNDELELLLRAKYLTTILQVGIFKDFYDARNFIMQAAIAYGVSMLGKNFYHYFNWPLELQVNGIHYFNQQMVSYIANKANCYDDTISLP